METRRNHTGTGLEKTKCLSYRKISGEKEGGGGESRPLNDECTSYTTTAPARTGGGGGDETHFTNGLTAATATFPGRGGNRGDKASVKPLWHKLPL